MASEGLRAAHEMPDVREPLAVRGSLARFMSLREVTAFIREQQMLWKPAVERVVQKNKVMSVQRVTPTCRTTGIQTRCSLLMNSAVSAGDKSRA